MSWKSLPSLVVTGAMSFVLHIQPATAKAQNLDLRAPLTSANQGFQQNFGVGFGWGGFDANSPNQLRFGNGPGSFGLSWSRESSRSMVTNSPQLTVQNGFGGQLFSGQLTPFVNGIVPIVGNGQILPHPVDNAVTRAISSGELELNRPVARDSSESDRLHPSGPIYSDPNSSATRGDISVAAIKALRKREQQQRQSLVAKQIEEAERLADQGDAAMARSVYREALRQSTDNSQKLEIKRRITSLREASR